MAEADHTRIWLEPAGAPDRCWCSDNQCGEEGVEYVLASQAQAALSAMKGERDAALEAEDEAKDAFWAVYPRYLELGGEPVSTEAARTALAAEVKRLTEEKEGLERIRGLMAEDWFDFCETMAVTPDTQEVVASDLIRRAETAEARIKALVDLIEQHGSAKLIRLARSTLQSERSDG